MGKLLLWQHMNTNQKTSWIRRYNLNQELPNANNQGVEDIIGTKRTIQKQIQGAIIEPNLKYKSLVNKPIRLFL